MEPKTKFYVKDKSVALLATVLFGFFLLGMAFPETWWGVHFLKFVSPGMLIFCMVIMIAILVYTWFGKDAVVSVVSKPDKVKRASLLSFGIGLIAAVLFYNLPMAGDIYGNSRGFQPVLDTTIKDLPSDFYSNLFSFEFVPGNGRGGVTLIVEFISYLFQVTMLDAFKIMDAFCGGAFVFVWLWSVNFFIKARGWRIIVALTGLTSPFLLIFFGHVETYAPVYLNLYLWLLLFVLYMRTKRSWYYWAMVPLLLIGVRLHTLMYLVVPAFAVASMYKFNLKTILKEKAESFKEVLKWMYAPMFAGGLILYFFVFEDFNDPRTLTDFKDIDRLFLPMVSPEPPLDNYNMFSIAHLLDFFNMILFWSPSLLLLLGYLILEKRKNLNWKLPEVNILLLTFLLFATILFAMNPLFSMPMDWDLFCFPVPILLLILVLLVAQLEEKSLSLKIPLLSAGLMLLCIPAFSVFLTLRQNSYRAERVGVHIYKTYYEHASTYLLMSIKMIKGNEEYEERMVALIKELEPHALKGNDQQFAELLVDKAYFDVYAENNPEQARQSLLKSMEYQRLQERFDQLAFNINKALVQQRYVFPQGDKEKADQVVEKGKLLLREKQEYEKALREFRYSRYYDPLNGRAILFSIEALFRMKRYAESFDYAVDLVALKYPDPKTALRIGIHTALEANKYDDALRYANIFLENFDPEETIVIVKERIGKQDRVKELKFLFNRGEE
ncbi:MAG: hypothetical protein NXI10_01915 [bacterium]|nr:hypothetical protein [bacterium]